MNAFLPSSQAVRARAAAWLLPLFVFSLTTTGLPAATETLSVEPGEGRLLPAQNGEMIAPPLSAAIVETPAPAVRRAPVIAVLDFETATLPSAEIEALSQAMWARLRQTGAVALLPRAATRRWLIANDLHPFMPYGPQVPLDQVARALRADFVLTGRLDSVNQTYTMEIELYSAGQPQPVLKKNGFQMATPSQILTVMEGMSGPVLEAAGRHDVASQLAPTAFYTPSQPDAGVAESGPVLRQGPIPKTRVATSVGNVLDEAEAIEIEPSPGKAVADAPAQSMVVQLSPVSHPEPAPMADQPVPVEETPAPTPEPTPQPTPAVTAAPAPQAPTAAARAAELLDQAGRLPMDSAERLTMLEEAARLAPADLAIARQLAYDYYLRTQYDRCVSHCDEALARTPGDSELLMIKGSALISLSEWEAARQACEAAIQADGKNNYARYNLALTLEMMNAPEAIQAWNDYLASAAGDPAHQEFLAMAKINLARLQKKP